MTVPLDKLYNFLDAVVNDDIVIYRWYPHGSKLLENLSPSKRYDGLYRFSNPSVVYHDQEPLDYFLHSDEEIMRCLINRMFKNELRTPEYLRKKIISNKLCLNYVQEITINTLNIHDNYLLVHSEKNSSEIDNYVKFGAIPVYYFSHALISRDWFRHAEIDPSISKKPIQKDFLIYQRAWSGSREYRLKFSELLVDSDVYSNCLTGFNPVDEHACHYTNHQFRNNQFEIQKNNLEDYFLINTINSNASADYVADDYNQTRIEIVLETLFDDQRWHLTEKVFRPIACGQPFILVSTTGALQYLRSYGFKTFNNYIDESYDQIVDPLKRLQAVIELMKSITSLSIEEKNNLFDGMQKIADFNKKLFFSKKFHKKIVNEYLLNIKAGLEKVKLHKGKCLKRWQILESEGVPRSMSFYLTEEQYQQLLKKI